MKRVHIVLAAALALLTATILVACGGGSSGSGPSASTPVPTEASGVLSAFGNGNVVVNGSAYGTNNSTSVVDGDNDDAPSTAAALQVGMTVDVDAGSGGWAQRIRFTSAVRGEVDAISSDGSTITVMGQTVLVTSATSFGGSDSLSTPSTVTNDTGGPGVKGSLQVGDYVSVYGFIECPTSTTTPCSSTDIVATLVYASTTPTVYRVEGYAQVAPGTTDTFTINGLTVDYTTTGASPTVCFPSPCSITNGTFVAVRSMTAPTTPAGGVLTLEATEIKTTTQIPVYAQNTTVSVEGLVSQLGPTTPSPPDMYVEMFNLRGLSIGVTSGVTVPPDLANGQLVDVIGTVQADGTIEAMQITIRRFATFTLVGPLTAESPATPTTPGTITVLGQTFTVNDATRFVDWAQFFRPFNASNFTSVLSIGNEIVVSGYSTSTGNVATRVERIPTPATPFAAAEGIVTADSSSPAPPATPSTVTLTIGGVVATLNTSTTLRYPGAGTTPTLAAFFGAVTVNTTVAAVYGVPGTSAGTLTASGAIALPSSCQWVFGPH